jgi:hypothetical protein
LSRRDKDAAVAEFAGDVPVLLSTESAGEGRNLQFCHVMINMDLPWNPMQIECAGCDVPVEICPACGQVWFTMDVAKRLDALFDRLLASGAETA